MTARGTQTVKYDPEQRPIRIQDGTSVHRATYDGDGVRRKREDSNGAVHYLGGYERKLVAGSSSSDTVTKYYSASLGAMSRPLAFRRGGTLHWAGTDHLGGTIRVLDSSFTALDGMRYKPFGEDRDTGSSLNTDRKFTGQTEDEAAGLYWYASRAYDPAIGRFVSPDTVVPVPFNPQSLNRYSYVYNNPLKYTDPTGHSPGYNVYDDKQWFQDFEEQYGVPPTASDIAYRQASMEAALRGDDFSVEYWKSNAESVARNAFKKVAKYITGGEAWAVAGLYSVLTGAGESEKNAVKHAYWSARLTEMFWIELAEEITRDHEDWNMAHEGQAEIDLRMDLYNNKVGREIGSRWPRIPGTQGNWRPHHWGVSIVWTALAANEGKLREIRDSELVSTPVDSLGSRIISRIGQLLGLD